MSQRDVVCLSHLPWAFALERPHQVMRRFARDRHVFFVEEPGVTDGELRTVMRTVEPNVHVVTLYAPRDMDEDDVALAYRSCVGSLAKESESPLLWVYSPSSIPAARDLSPSLLVYDCVADHASRRGASPELRAYETELLASADLVITAGSSLFEAKRGFNVSTYPLPSSVDADDFALHVAAVGRRGLARAGSRIGFLGPIDERVDLALVDALAAARPDCEIILLGGLVGVTTWQLPDRPNVRWLGAKRYAELPAYVASWDVAVVPFRDDAATRRTEASGLLACLAAGKPIVTTPLDEISRYAELGLVRIAAAAKFLAAVDDALVEAARGPRATAKLRAVREGVLARTSWDRTFGAMATLIGEAEMTRRLVAREGGSRPSPFRARDVQHRDRAATTAEELA